MNYLNKMNDKEYNKQLIEKYPFLLPRNRWTGKVPADYDYSYTELDAMPEGWRKAFGEQMCQEIEEELEKYNLQNEYRISQIKEKYGSLCWYDFGCTEKIVREIIPTYEKLSTRICIKCGKPATKMTLGWISPYCDDCCPESEYATSIEEYTHGVQHKTIQY